MALSILAIYFTYTRGLYVLLAFGLLAFYLKTHEVNIFKIVGLMLVVLLLYEVAEVLEIFQFDDTYLENREESDSVRLITIDQVFDRITWWSLLIGHGFGQGVPERPAHMEISTGQYPRNGISEGAGSRTCRERRLLISTIVICM